MDARPVGVEAAAIAYFVVGERLILGDKVDDVEAETVHPLLGPEVDDVFHLGAHRRIFPVEIRLLAGKQVQVVLAGSGIQLPGAAAKLGLPVVGHAAIHRIAPNVVVAVGAVFIPQRRLEPGVLGGGVVHYYIHHDADVARVGGSQQRLEICHGAVGGVDGKVVGNVVAVVHLRGYVDRGQPEGIDPQGFEIVEAGHDPLEVAGATGSGILKALGVNLVNHGTLPPGCLAHGSFSCLEYEMERATRGSP